MAHVTIPAADPYISYAGDGVTDAFPFPFPFFDAGDISVYVDGTEVTGDFAVAGDALDGGFEDGTVTFTDPPAEGTTIILVRRLDIERVTDFPYPSQVIDIQSLNTELDRIVAMIQGVGLDSRRALRVPASEITVNELPGIEDRANRVLVFDGFGQPQALTIGEDGDLSQAAVELLVNSVLGRLFPPGMIILWAGSSGSIPPGWALCNGSNGTPDLRNRFVVGAGQTYSVNATGGATSVATSGGGSHNHGGSTGSHQLTTAEMPSHFHSMGTLFVREIGSGGTITGVGNFASGADNTQAAGGDAAHAHTISTQGDHTHTVATLPPYYALCYIMRTGFFVPADDSAAAELTAAALQGVLQFACGDETTAIDAPATDLITLRAPFALSEISSVRASLNGPCATGTFEVDIKVGGASILSTPLTIDATEKTSTTAAVPAVLSTTTLTDDAEITVDVVDEGDGTAFGLKVAIIGLRAA